MGSFRICLALMIGVSLGRSAGAACVVNQVAELPVTMDGLRPMLHVKMEGQNERLLLDSGAFYSLLSPAVAEALKIRQRSAAGLVMEGVGGGFVAMAGYVKSLSFGKATMSNVGFMIGGSETGGAGLIGQDLLHGFDVDYDLAQGIVRLLKPKDCAGQSLAYWAKDGYAAIDIGATTQLQPHAIGIVYVNGSRLRAMFDTGASTTIISSGAAARLGAKPGSSGVVEAGYSSGIGSGTSKSWIAPFDSFKIGPEEVKHVRLRFGAVGLEGFDMLIGADFFLSHHVLIANSQNKLYFTYNGGPIFDLSVEEEGGVKPRAGATTTAKGTAQPLLQTASEYARRSAARAALRDLPGALADLDQAILKDGADADYLARRAALHRRMGHDDLALADFDRSVSIRPDDARALASRADLHLDMHRRDNAVADVDRAAALAPQQADLRLELGGLYERADEFDKAVRQYDLWLKAHPADNKKAGALNGRCWARALAGRDLDLALTDCNIALYLAPKSADILDSRGLVRLRRGELDRALADYDTALSSAPNLSWSLYGRSLIERRRGETVKADADRAAAIKIDNDVEIRAKRYGIAP